MALSEIKPDCKTLASNIENINNLVHSDRIGSVIFSPESFSQISYIFKKFCSSACVKKMFIRALLLERTHGADQSELVSKF